MAKSKKQGWYKQCTFRSPSEGGEFVQTAWVPERFAVEGKRVYFGKKTSSPDRVWFVASAGNKRLPGDYVAERERDYKTQRQASDI